MSLFSTKKTLEEVLLAQVEHLQAELKTSESARETERARHEKKEAEFFTTQQDLIHTIMLLKGIPVYEHDEHGQQVEVKAVPSMQRRSWPSIIAGRELEARNRATERARQIAEANKRKAGGVH